MDKIIDELLEIEGVDYVLTKKVKENPAYTHVFIGISSDNLVFARVSYDERSKKIIDEKRNVVKRDMPFHTDYIEAQEVESIHKEDLVKLINGGLRWTLEDHGEIKKDQISSASKRITTLIYNFLGNRIKFKQGNRQLEYRDGSKYLPKKRSVSTKEKTTQ